MRAGFCSRRLSSRSALQRPVTVETAETDWDVCFASPLEFEAHVVRGYLEHYGVPCELRSNRFGMEPLTFGALGQVQVLVPPQWSRVARGLIRGRLGEGARENRRFRGKDTKR